MANTYLTRTPSGTGNKTKFTFSVWIKKLYQATGTNRRIVSSYFSNGGRHAFLTFGTDEQLYAFSGNYTSGASTSDSYRLNSSRKFRDTNAFYHIVYRVDTTQTTASDRIRCYINGELLEWDTSHADHLYPNQGDENYINSDYPFQINALNGNEMMDCVMSHINFCDGQSYDATAFGQYDANGVWTIKTSPSVTYGTNGFFILKDGNSVTDQSGNSNNFTVGGGTLTNTEDSPSNVFCTINPLAIASNGQGTATLSNGNLTITSAGSSQNSGTLAPSIDSNSKWYYEFKCGSGATDIDSGVGWSTDVSAFRSGTYATLNSFFLYTADGRLYGTSGWTAPSTAPTYTNGDIIGCTVDLENNEIKWYKNNSLAYTISSISFVGDVITPFSQWSQSGAIGNFNFGNGYFGTTAVSSAGTNASGIGIFEYDVPTGFTALSTKGLNL